MPFTVDEFRDLIRLLAERPDWRHELRQLLLSEALLALPEQLAASRLETERRFQELAAQMAALVQEHRQFAQEQGPLAQRVDTLAQQMLVLTQRVDDLAQRVDMLAQQMLVLTQRVDDLAQRVDMLTQQMLVLTQRVDDLTQQMIALTKKIDVMDIDLADVKGDNLERRYRERAPAYFGRLMRRTRVLPPEDVATLVEEAVDRGMLSDTEAEEVTWADLVVRGTRREDGTDVYLVVEVSWRVDEHDVERAAQRAGLLSRLGLVTLPVVAGKAITDEASRLAQATQVWRLIEGGGRPA